MGQAGSGSPPRNWYELRVTVFDVDRKGWLDSLADAVGGAFKAVAGAVTSLSGILKPVADEAAATIGRKITNNDDKTLVVHSGDFNRNERGSYWSIKHAGYEFVFEAVELDHYSERAEGE